MMNKVKEEDEKTINSSYKFTLYFIVLLWFIKVIEYALIVDFSFLGIMPRTLQGATGIFLAPLIHVDFYHLLSNTFPILLLGTALFYFYDKIAVQVVLSIYLISGFWVWLVAREAYHIGASGVVYGLLSFLLISGFIRKGKSALAISFIILVLYGGSFIYGVFPTTPGVSWESHLMGAIAGAFCAIYFRKASLSTFISSAEDPKEIPEVDYHYVSSSDTVKNNIYNYTYVSAPNEKKQKDQEIIE